MLLALTFATLASAGNINVAERFTGSELESFFKFKTEFSKTYSTEAEEASRFETFRENLALVEILNDEQEKEMHKVYGVTKFMDMTQEEFASMNKRTVKTAAERREELPTWDGECTACERFPEIREYVDSGANPTSMDWTSMGAVTAVKDQGQCGSCWSFGTTGDIEGTWFIANGTLTPLSEEVLVQCDSTGNAGCNGGLQEWAFAWIIRQGGITSEDNYPYTSGTGVTGSCKSSKETPYFASISSWYQVSDSTSGESNIEDQLVQTGPITIGIDATPMQFYTGGIDNPAICSGSSSSLDHAVLITGYNTQAGTDYWIIKNSWGSSWGEKGYYWIVKDECACGVCMDAVHSVV